MQDYDYYHDTLGQQFYLTNHRWQELNRAGASICVKIEPSVVPFGPYPIPSFQIERLENFESAIEHLFLPGAPAPGVRFTNEQNLNRDPIEIRSYAGGIGRPAYFSFTDVLSQNDVQDFVARTLFKERWFRDLTHNFLHFGWHNWHNRRYVVKCDLVIRASEPQPVQNRPHAAVGVPFNHSAPLRSDLALQKRRKRRKSHSRSKRKPSSRRRTRHTRRE